MTFKSNPDKTYFDKDGQPLNSEGGRWYIPLACISRDQRAQPRAEMSEDLAEEYRQAVADGVPLPPVSLFFDGTEYWLADGWHRFEASRRFGKYEVAAVIYDGSLRDAILFSCGANAAHGLRRTNADKRRAVETMLKDEEWSNWSDHDIAKQCAVSHMTVGRTRAELRDTGILCQYGSDRTFVHPKTGLPTTMKTENIGKSKSKQETLPVETPQAQVYDFEAYRQPESTSVPDTPATATGKKKRQEPFDPKSVKGRVDNIVWALQKFTTYPVTADEFWSFFTDPDDRDAIIEHIRTAGDTIDALREAFNHRNEPTGSKAKRKS